MKFVATKIDGKVTNPRGEVYQPLQRGDKTRNAANWHGEVISVQQSLRFFDFIVATDKTRGGKRISRFKVTRGGAIVEKISEKYL